ncbi:amidohydrolase family protein [Steroidobacter flavus]|uniref:Amidohydrolase family protein n=1 Tax=Steroidobacter flavus TaxID=1842136 RepID=A0ABV8T3V6_9GAMM
MLIRHAELKGGGIVDVRIERGVITAIGQLDAGDDDDEPTLDANNGLLLPGLHDHHIHVAALAASLSSVRCGPPDVTDRDTFAARLQTPGTDWLRATGYHESVAGMLDTATLDRIAPNRPVRVQHRSGRMWFFNSVALDRLLNKSPPPKGLEHDGTRYTGRLFDEDAWLQRTLGSEPPSFAQVGAMLASRGITGLTEMSPANDSFMARHFIKETGNRDLPQRAVLAGRLSLGPNDTNDRVLLGPAKLHLHEAALPTLDDAADFIRRAHEQGRGVAVHCATEVEIVFTLAAFNDAGTLAGDRIEHASIAPNSAIEDIARAGIAVVSQPHFIRERGDRYLTDVDADARQLLYRLRSFLDADVTLAGGSDAPFGGCDPWASMAAAVSRHTESGAAIGASEALTPEQALDLFLRDPTALNRYRHVTIGAPADLCLLDRSWAAARSTLSSAHVRATFIDGRMIFNRDTEGMT